MSESAASPVYFLLHVPKSAGTTIEDHLRYYMVRQQLWMPPPPSTLAMLRGRRFRHDGIPDLGEVRALSGHWLARSLENRFPGRAIRRTLLLRDPIGFHVSLYNHRMMFALARGLPTCTFERHFWALPRDLVAIFLLWQWLELPPARLITTSDEDKYALLNKVLADFWFVGAHSDCDRLIASIAGDLGVPAAAQRRNTSLAWQRSVAWQPLTPGELPVSTRAKILSRNPIHAALWENWREAGFDPARVRPRPLPKNRQGRLGLGSLLHAAIFVQSIGFGELIVAPLWEPAIDAGRAGDWQRALLLYREALRRVPGFPEVWVGYGHALLQSGDPAAAEAAYRRAVELDGTAAAPHLHHGQALRLLSRMDEAREAFRNFERLDPTAWQHKCEELVTSGLTTQDVTRLWRSLTEEPGLS
jgi:tetratricopeptide (TPR) repeat protein